MSKATIVCVWLLAACATGGSNGGGGSGDQIDAAVQQDSSTVVPADAAVSADAAVTHDAQTSQTPDAGSGSGGLFCTSNTDCTVAGECCVNLGGPGFCAAGTPVGNSICFPD